MNPEIPKSSDGGLVRNLRREPWSKTGLFYTRYDLLVGEEWVDVKAHDFGNTTYTYPDGTKIMEGDGQIVTLHANGDMTVVREDGLVDDYSAASMEEGAVAIAEALRELTEGGGSSLIEIHLDE